MFRKTMLLVTLATTLAAGSAFAAQSVTGQVTRVDAANGDIWLDNGTKFDVGTTLADGILAGDRVTILYDDFNNHIDVITASPAS